MDFERLKEEVNICKFFLMFYENSQCPEMYNYYYSRLEQARRIIRGRFPKIHCLNNTTGGKNDS